MSCELARRHGFDTIQYPYLGENNVEQHLKIVEIVGCHDACYRTRRFSLRGACVGGLVQAGNSSHPCVCNRSREVLNCDLSKI